MKIVIATDSFKGCLSSLDAGNSIKNGILRSIPDAGIKVFPISDGGEGLSEALKKHFNTEPIETEVTGPEFDKVRTSYGFSPDKKLAVIEMAAAAGLPLVKGKKDAEKTTTYGVGELIADALGRGAREFVIGIGGSATNDGGTGMLSALGFRFLDKNGNDVSKNALGLKDLASIDISGAGQGLEKTSFTVACDVDIPLCGENGCSVIFAPQKGAGLKEIEEMDRWLSNYAALTKKIFPDSDMNYPGSGAAGGMGFALRSYLNAELKPGIDIVISLLGLEKEIQDADIVVTGEGRIDSQTARGKVVSGITRIAEKYGKPVIAFCGSAAEDAADCGLAGIYPVTPPGMCLEEAMKKETAIKNIESAAEKYAKSCGF